MLKRKWYNIVKLEWSDNMQNVVDTIVLPGIEIKIKDCEIDIYNEANMYITDAFVKAEEFETFLSFYKEHREPGKYFNAVVNSKGFYGRFGQFVYSDAGDHFEMRLVFVEAAADVKEELERPSFSESVVTHDASYINLVNLVVKQEVIINQLKAILEEKGILSPAEVQSVFTAEGYEIENTKFELRSKVKNLNEYLKDQKDTLDHFRNSKI
jgi:hypothetical protein